MRRRSCGKRSRLPREPHILLERYRSSISIGCSLGRRQHVYAASIFRGTRSLGFHCRDAHHRTDSKQLRRIYCSNVETERVNGVPVTTLARTALDCVFTMEPCAAIAILDACFRAGLTQQELLQECVENGMDCSAVLTLLPHVNPSSENGGEAYAHAVITAQLGFRKPQQQVELIDPLTNNTHRPDFYWVLEDGTIIVAELDGSEKYVNPQMTGARAIHEVVADEREREKSLERAGVKRIVRFTFDEVLHSDQLRDKLLDAGVPTDFKSVVNINGHQVAVIE
ncbi:CTP synthase [Bifidobacterium sp. GSD1FS]|uniref:CTP synthase n=1 Tax=Bifidobacterium canis TaxID=2610880 RepID=A0A7K1J600_9BIFI|nr:CTP synthase [Bifidobacterium canis]